MVKIGQKWLLISRDSYDAHYNRGYQQGYKQGGDSVRSDYDNKADKIKESIEMMQNIIKRLEDENGKYNTIILNQAEVIRNLKRKHNNVINNN